jgi:hypothetical protein
MQVSEKLPTMQGVRANNANLRVFARALGDRFLLRSNRLTAAVCNTDFRCLTAYAQV